MKEKNIDKTSEQQITSDRTDGHEMATGAFCGLWHPSDFGRAPTTTFVRC